MSFSRFSKSPKIELDAARVFFYKENPPISAHEFLCRQLLRSDEDVSCRWYSSFR